jgi:hypothetical protein
MCNVLGIAQRGNQPRTQKQPDLAIYDFHRGGSSPTLLDAVFTDSTASSYRRNASSGVFACGASRRPLLRLWAQASQRTGAELSEDDLDAARISYLEEQWHIKRNQFRCQDANKWDERVGDCHVKSAGYEKNER